MLVLINSDHANKSGTKIDAGIILGAALWNDTPSPALRERLNLAISLYEEGKVDRFILTGGLGGLASTLTEAEGMQSYLVSKGIPEDKLLLEKKATSTYQNLLYSKEIADEQGFKHVAIITHDYHAARSLEIAHYLDYESVEAQTLKSRVLNMFYHQTREVLALTKWKLDWLTYELGLRSPDSEL